MNSKDEIKEELDKLNDGAVELSKTLKGEKEDEQFPYAYQVWYTKAISLISFLAPDRAVEFKSYYEIDPKRKILSWGTWVIQDYIKQVLPNITAFNPIERANLCFADSSPKCITV